jgi:hypothetical protein
MNQDDNTDNPVETNLGPGEPSPRQASNSATPDPARNEERGLDPAGVGERSRFRDLVAQNNAGQAIMIEGYAVPSSLAATAIPEPYWLPPQSRSMVGMLADFGGAALVAGVVALFATGELPTPWNNTVSGKTEERFTDAATRADSPPDKLEPSLPAPPQASVAAARLKPESQSAGLVAAPPSASVTTAQPADAALNQSPSTVLGASTDFNEADKSQPTTAAISPTESSVRTSLPFVQFIIARELQSELKRVGCDPGNIDGDWNAASRRALENFNEHAGTNLDVEVANFSALSVVRSRMSRICPVACDRGSRVRGSRCLEVETQSVRRTADRNHMKRRRSTPSATRMPVGATTSRDARSEPARTNLR